MTLNSAADARVHSEGANGALTQRWETHLQGGTLMFVNITLLALASPTLRF